MAVRPAAGPLTLSCDPLKIPITIPPAMPAMMPENKGALEPSAIPRQSGRAMRKTTIEAERSAPKLASPFVWLIHIKVLKTIKESRIPVGECAIWTCCKKSAIRWLDQLFFEIAGKDRFFSGNGRGWRE